MSERPQLKPGDYIWTSDGERLVYVRPSFPGIEYRRGKVVGCYIGHFTTTPPKRKRAPK